MKKYYPPLIRVLFCIFLSIAARQASGQFQVAREISTGPNSNGFYEYLPTEYHTDTTKTFPLIIFLIGEGQLGNGTTQLPIVAQAGIPHVIGAGQWPDSFVVGGKSFQFVVISPQFVSWPSDTDVNDIIQYAIAHYRIDTGRVYLTGLSMGGSATWSYASNSQWAGSLAAIVPICGGTNWHGMVGADAMAANNLPIFAAANKWDNLVPDSTTIEDVAEVNSVIPAINPTALDTIYPNRGHNAWDTTYNPNHKLYRGLNIYQWMLLYSRDPGGNMSPPPLPPTITSFTPTTGGPGTNISISGSGLTGANSVTFGGVPASFYTILSDSVIVAIVGNGASGSVQVTNPSAAASLAGFTFIGVPVINSFTPASGGQGVTVTISGSGFTAANSVTFGGVPASAFAVVSDNVITAIVDTGATGSVVVTSSYGTATLAGFTFTVPPPPPIVPPPAIPLGFVTFTATVIGSLKPEVQLSWSDSSEVDNRYFIVQRSTDSVQFSAIDTVSAIPNLDSGMSYSYIDPNAPPDSGYYQVWQIHVDGTASISPVRKVITGPGSGVTPMGPETTGMWLSPNPATSTLYVTIGGSVSETMEFRLVDISGNVLREWIFQKTDNNWIQQVDIAGVVPGMYFIQAFSKDWSNAQPFIKRW